MEFLAGFLVGVAALPFFWFIFVGVLGLLTITVVNERGFLSTVLTLAFGALVLAKLPTIIANPALVLGAIGAYALIGVLWSRFKWSRYLTQQFEKYTSIRARWLNYIGFPADALKDGLKGAAILRLQPEYQPAKHRKTTVTVEKQSDDDQEKARNNAELELMQSYIDFTKHSTSVNEINFTGHEKTLSDYALAVTPQAANSKGSIVMWIVYWPISLVWYLLADLVKDAATAIYNAVGGHFQKMSSAKFEQL